MSHKTRVPKNENLGRGIIKLRRRNNNVRRANKDEFFHTAALPEEEVVVTRSIVEQNSLDTFLQLAELADAKFVGERQAKLAPSSTEQQKVRIAAASAIQAEHLAKQMNEALDRIGRLPQRVKFTEGLSAAQFEQSQRTEFLNWRRQLAELEEKLPTVVMTPYERNSLIWREFWRVFERSDIIVQVLDARNPMLFRCADIEQYAAASKKRSVLLLNKADFLSIEQRISWLKYFQRVAPSCKTILFSAKRESEKLQEFIRASKRPTLGLDGSQLPSENLTQHYQKLSSHDDDDIVGQKLVADADSESVDEKLTDVDEESDGSGAESEKSAAANPESVDNEDGKKVTNDNEQMESDGDEAEENNEDDEVDTSSDGDSSDGGEDAEEIDQSSADRLGLDARDKVVGLDATEDDTHLWSVSDLLRYFVTLNSGADQDQEDVNDSNRKTSERSKHDSKSETESESGVRRLLTVGFVGYPNVGKSSTINALLGRKRVAVSATPGKTKHMQTFKLDIDAVLGEAEGDAELPCNSLLIADCPGLVFVNAVATRADLVLNGVLSTDQLGDPLPVTAAICQLFDRNTLEQLYGLEHVMQRPATWQPTDRTDADALLTAIGVSRHLMTAKGVPNRFAAVRMLLRDFLNGKLLYCYPPPDCSEAEFRPTCRVAQLIANMKHTSTAVASSAPDVPSGPTQRSEKTGTSAVKQILNAEQAFDERFFARMNDVKIGTRGCGTTATSYRSRATPNQNGDPAAPSSVHSSVSNLSAVYNIRDLPKKHNKRNKREKLRRVYNYLDN